MSASNSLSRRDVFRALRSPHSLLSGQSEASQARAAAPAQAPRPPVALEPTVFRGTLTEHKPEDLRRFLDRLAARAGRGPTKG